MAGAPLGNQNKAENRIWREALRQALDRRTKSRADGKAELDLLADKLIDACLEGQIPAFREFGDRVEGKPAQQIQLADNEGGKLEIRVISYADSP